MAILRASIILMLAEIFACPSIKNAVAIESSELIRASIIEKVASFIEWPSSNRELFEICAFADTPLLPALEAYYANSRFNEKPVKLAAIRNFTTSSTCQVLYLSATESLKLDNILNQISNQPILVISEKKDAVSQGAHIDFFVEDNRLHLEVNRIALSKNDLKASYHLLGVARIVE